MATTIWKDSGVLQHRLTVPDPAFGAIVYFFDGGTTTPKIVYADSSESISLGSAVTVDGNARWPNIFVPTGGPYDYRVIDASGEQIIFVQNVPNPDPGEGGGTPPPATNYATGDHIWRPQVGTYTGFVRANGQTIGSATSGATERANADTEDLFTFLWNNVGDAQCPVVGGRGASAAADFAANKQLTLLDFAGRQFMGLDDMGAGAQQRLNDAPFANGNSSTVGSAGGYNSAAIAEAKLPTHSHALTNIPTSDNGEHNHAIAGGATSEAADHTHGFTTSVNNVSHTHGTNDAVTGGGTGTAEGGTGQQVVTSLTKSDITTSGNSVPHFHTGTTNDGGKHSHTVSGGTSSDGSHAHTINGATDPIGTGENFSVVDGLVLGTVYVKL